jgi:hypothetical protein
MSVPDICRGALTFWPQLTRALDIWQAAAPGRSLFALPAGGPTLLLAALAANPALLVKDAPPADIYGRFVWTASLTYRGARMTSMTLSHLPDLAGPEDAGAAVSRALSALAQQAVRIADSTGDFVKDLATAGIDLAAAAREQAARAQAFAQAPSPPGPALLAHATAAQAAGALRARLADYEAASARLTANGVLDNLAQAMAALTQAWRAASAQFAAAASAVAPARWPAPDGLRQDLALPAAQAAWDEFALTVRDFIERMLRF